MKNLVWTTGMVRELTNLYHKGYYVSDIAFLMQIPIQKVEQRIHILQHTGEISRRERLPKRRLKNKTVVIPDEKIPDIYDLFISGMNYETISKSYGVVYETIRRICKGMTRRDIFEGFERKNELEDRLKKKLRICPKTKKTNQNDPLTGKVTVNVGRIWKPLLSESLFP